MGKLVMGSKTQLARNEGDGGCGWMGGCLVGYQTDRDLSSMANSVDAVMPWGGRRDQATPVTLAPSPVTVSQL